MEQQHHSDSSVSWSAVKQVQQGSCCWLAQWVLVPGCACINSGRTVFSTSLQLQWCCEFWLDSFESIKDSCGPKLLKELGCCSLLHQLRIGSTL